MIHCSSEQLMAWSPQSLKHYRINQTGSGPYQISVRESESDPSVSDKRFRVSNGDLNQATLLPRLFRSMKKIAHNIAIDSYQVHRRDMGIELASGNLDLAIDVPLTPDPQIKQMSLSSNPYVCVIHKDNPIVKDSLDLETYLKLKHVHVSSRRGGLGHVDLALGKMGKKREIILRTQNHLVPIMALTTDFAVTLPLIFADFLARTSMYDTWNCRLMYPMLTHLLA